MTEHSPGCSGLDHTNAQSHFVCRAFDGHNFQPIIEDSKIETEVLLTSQSGRKIRMSVGARAALRSKSTHVESPMITRRCEDNSSQGD